MKGTKVLLAAAGVVALIVVAGIVSMGMIYQGTGANAVSYYSRIDNEKAAAIPPHGGMNYRYSLQVYGEDGEGKALDLDTSRILKDGAFIRIEVAALRGVISWEEVQYEELPAPVQQKYAP